MKKIITTFLLSILISTLFAEIAVKSFRKLENDLDARVYAKKIDQNGDVCAIIKVVTTQTGFFWEPDGLGIVAAESKVGEYWLYVPFGAKRLTIKHDKLGILRNYLYPMPIEKATVYELVLVTGKVITTVEEEITSQWLVINTEPADAMVYLDGQFVKSGMYQTKLKPGSYTYRVEAPLYYPEIGKVAVADEKKELNVKLKPAFGNISVTSEPEQDVKVLIDGKLQQKTTPCQSEPLASGEHTVQVFKDMFQPTTQKTTVIEGQITPLNFVLNPNFAEVYITSTNDAAIYINNQKKGTGKWQGRLNPGVYSLEASQDNHRPAKKDIELVSGSKDTIELEPTPIYGSLDVMTNPSGASIFIDGKDFGTTPNTLSNLLIGNCNIQLKKTGYASVQTTVIIAEGKSTELVETLTEAKNTVNKPEPTVRIGSLGVVTIPMNASILIDGKDCGKTPYIVNNLPIGEHTLELKLPEYISITKTFTISEGKTTNFVETLSNKRKVKISSFPDSTNLFIDEKMVGKTPYVANLSLGKHIFRIELGNQKTEKIINVEQTDSDENFTLTFVKLISIDSNPQEAYLNIDGNFIGKTPLEVELSYGKHTFKINKEDKLNIQELEINNESTSDLYFHLFDCNSVKTITSNPSGAIVLINNEEKGVTPLNYNLSKKQEAITLKLKGYMTYKDTLFCDSNNITLNLKSYKDRPTRVFISGGITYPLIKNYGIDFSNNNLGYNLKFGLAKTTGVYIGFSTNFSKTTFDYSVNNLPDIFYSKTITSSSYNRLGVVGGLMLNVNPVVLYAGVGWGYYKHFVTTDLYKYTDDTYEKTVIYGDKNSFTGIETNTGIILNLKPFGVSFGVSSIEFKYVELTLGLAIVL